MAGGGAQGAGFGTYMPNPLPPAPSGQVPWAQGYESGGTGAGFNYTGVPKLLPGPEQPYGAGAGQAPPAFASSPNTIVPPAAMMGPPPVYAGTPDISPAPGGISGGTTPTLSSYQSSSLTPLEQYYLNNAFIQSQTSGNNLTDPDHIARLAQYGMTPTSGGGNTYGYTYTSPSSSLPDP
jgi:hypothetical protein